MSSSLPEIDAQHGATSAPSFALDAGRALQDVRRALADFVAAVPGDTKRLTDLQKALGVDTKICWQIFNVVRGEGSLSPAIHVPTLPALKRAMSAAERIGVSSDVIEAVRSSLEDFEKVVAEHAGTRQDFDAMVAAVSPDETSEQLQLKHRRSVYRGLSHIWGTQVDVLTATTLVRRGETGTDQLILSTKRGMRRLRPDAYMKVYAYRLSLDPSFETQETRPIEPGTIERYGAPLAPEFCSQPLPEFRMRTDGEGWNTSELAGSNIGRLSDMDLAFGTISQGIPMPRDVDGRPWIGANVLLGAPTGLLVLNLLVHRESFGPVDPELLVFAHVPGTDAPAEMRRLALPLRERIPALGRADQISKTPDDPVLPDLLRTGCEAVGWDLSEFDGYRVRIPFPVLHTVVRLFFSLDGAEDPVR